MKYIVIEIQTNSDGTVGILSFSYDDRNEAESKYHTILASAAISSIPSHCAFMLSDDGVSIKSECYRHEQEVIDEGPIDSSF